MFSLFSKTTPPTAQTALEGRAEAIPTAQTHFVYGNALKAAVDPAHEVVIFGMGCFWGVERIFWSLDGVVNTSVGYAAGFTPNPTYDEVCSGQTGHNEVVRVVYDPAVISFDALLKTFWEGHDPTQGMRQGNDRGTQYRSGIYVTTPAQMQAAQASQTLYAPKLAAAGYEAITTEILQAPAYYYAEDYHQQYLAKNPQGYCGIGGTGVSCPIGVVQRTAD
ncbi:peptide-methionine (S)-S-oxide reductase [Pacificibacter maritimus]|uniref:Peptide methionine sulfoxide reductase MsrA n=1 Tax=Pacificibacter maritimus TaxID=762213 RepID=A0A3N4V2G0_9RHOB|nr:peptide-methionine (S)-S-oxide reductase MsrA [Pacificibacter maritimus]RPE67104.1 peptide-methionine (S)-S-oxide reductase [Pacificibacter maritimus]